MSPEQLSQIRKFAEEVAAREGCLLYDLEFREGPGRSLRVFIDKSGGGVSIEDCSNVSKGLNLRLDIEDVVPGGHYDLEVSSPGLDRRLTQLWHFGGVVGQTVLVKYKHEDGSSRSYEGRLTGVNGSLISFTNAKGDLELDFSKIERAKVVLVDLLAKKPAPGKKKKR